MYDETWADKLYRGVQRNLSMPFRFVCFVDQRRYFRENIEQMPLRFPQFDYSCFSEPYRLGKPMILMGLDTVITGDIHRLAEYCLTSDTMALPRDPNHPEIACNGVALVPEGHQDIAENPGENDMKWVRRFPHVFIDDVFPGEVVSYKGHVKKHGLGGARIVYFHGHEKPNEIEDEWVKEHWR